MNKLPDNSKPSIWAEHLRQNDTAVALLIVLQQGDDHTGQGETRSIEGMCETGCCSGLRAKADIGAAGLKIAAVGAGADLEPLATAWSPHFNIV